MPRVVAGQTGSTCKSEEALRKGGWSAVQSEHPVRLCRRLENLWNPLGEGTVSGGGKLGFGERSEGGPNIPPSVWMIGAANGVRVDANLATQDPHFELQGDLLM